MSKINKVLYNVDQRTDNVAENDWLWMARHNIGLDDDLEHGGVIGKATTTDAYGKKTCGIAPLDGDGKIPSICLPDLPAHTHGNISNDGKIGSTSGLPLVTTTGGLVTTGAFGTAAGQFASGNHTHGNITNDGKISSDTNVVSGHKIVTTDGNGTVSRSNLSFSNASGAGNQVLTQAGSWAQFIGTSATTAAAGDHTHSVAVASTSGTGGSAGFMSAADKEKLNNLNAVNDGSLYVKFGNNSPTKEFSANQSSDHTMLFSNVANTGQYSDLINKPRFETVKHTVNNVTIAEGTYTFPHSAYEFSDVTVSPGSIFIGSMILQDFDFSSQLLSKITMGWILGTNGSNFTMEFERANGPWTYVVPMCCDNTTGSSTLTVNLILNGSVDTTNTSKQVIFHGMLIDFSIL